MRLRALVPALALASACHSTEAFELAASARQLPEAGPGIGLELEQRVGGSERLALALQLGLEVVPLDEEGPRGDEWKRVWCGLGVHAPGGLGPRAGAGITWLRTDAGVQGLEEFGDYGGAYLALGYAWRLAPRLATGPELSGAWLDSEGDESGSGSFVELAWRVAFLF